MSENSTFHFSIPRPEGALVELSFAEAEQFFLRRLDQERDHPEDATWELARFYSRTGRQDLAEGYIRQLMERAGDPESRGAHLLALGQFAEQRSDYAAAVQHYRRGLGCEPRAQGTAYFLHNNLGYCLNVLGEHVEAESLCRAAIRIEPLRSNAHKNLGISFLGQERLEEAARAFVDAVRANAADPRALRHLEELVAAHPELEWRVPELRELLRDCKNAVQFAANLELKMRPPVQRGIRKWWFLLLDDLRWRWSRLLRRR